MFFFCTERNVETLFSRDPVARGKRKTIPKWNAQPIINLINFQEAHKFQLNLLVSACDITSKHQMLREVKQRTTRGEQQEIDRRDRNIDIFICRFDSVYCLSSALFFVVVVFVVTPPFVRLCAHRFGFDVRWLFWIHCCLGLFICTYKHS